MYFILLNMDILFMMDDGTYKGPPIHCSLELGKLQVMSLHRCMESLVAGEQQMSVGARFITLGGKVIPCSRRDKSRTYAHFTLLLTNWSKRRKIMVSTNDEQSSKPLRVAIIGYGLAGAVFHAPLIASTPGMEVVAIVTNNAARQKQAKRDFPDAEVLSTVEHIWRNAADYDLVVVATANRAHVPLGLAAMEAGLPVVIDKPMAASVRDAEKLIDAGKRTGKLLTVFQNRRWDNDFLTVRKLIAGDVLGKITRFESRFERYRVEPRTDSWRESAAEEASGLLYDLGSHLIDQALQLFGQPVSVYAEVEKRRPGAQVDDDSFVALHFANGVHAHLWMSVVARSAGPRYRIYGLRGTYEKWGVDPQEPDLVAGKRPGDPNWGMEPRERWGQLSTDIAGVHVEGAVETMPGAYERYYAILRDALVAGGAAPVDPADAVAALRVIEAAQESARSGTVVGLG
jgi:scyllo-inositol 2-dehydrogenase (NADP+)